MTTLTADEVASAKAAAASFPPLTAEQCEKVAALLALTTKKAVTRR